MLQITTASTIARKGGTSQATSLMKSTSTASISWSPPASSATETDTGPAALSARMLSP